MTSELRLQQLLAQWEEARERHEPITPDELCRDCPDLLEELTRRVRQLERLDAVLARSGGSGEVPSTTPGDFTVPNNSSALLPELGASGERFRLLAFYRQGGLGEVYHAEDKELDRHVALKRIKPLHAHKADLKQRFLREAKLTGKLEHPGIVPVYGLVNDSAGQPYYAMRFVEGKTLDEAIREFHAADQPGRAPGERSLALRQLLIAFVTVCKTLAYAHSRGVIHRDLKPANIMLGQYGETLVLDWGLAKELPSGSTREARLRSQGGEREQATTQGGVDPITEGELETPAGGAIGTPAFMSPEQAAGRWEVVGPASDIYGLGATLYVVLTGQAPFVRGSWPEMQQRVLRGDFPAPRLVKNNTPRPLEAVCLKAMALHPEDRYATALALAADIEHWLADEPVVAYREPWTGKLRRWVRWHRALASGLAALLVTAVIALAVGLAAVETQKQRAERALLAETQAKRRTQQALDEMSSQLIENWLSRQKGKLEPAQEEFLNRALAYYRAFAEESADSEEIRLGVARAHRRVGDIAYRLGKPHAAEEAYRRAIAYDERLIADFPGVPEFSVELAQSLNNLGVLLWSAGRKEAEQAYRDAVALYKRLVTEFPFVPAYRQGLAGSSNNLAIVLTEMGRPREAEDPSREALALYKKLAADFPAILAYRRELATGHYNLGNLLFYTGRLKDAESAYRDAIACQKQLAREFPTEPEYRRDLALSETNLGRLLGSTARPGEAEEAYRNAVGLQKQLVADFPAVPEYRRQLARSYSYLGITLESMSRLEEAERAYRDALILQKQLAADFPSTVDYHGDLAASHNNLALLLQSTGRWKQAEDEFREAISLQEHLAGEFPKVPGYRHELATSHNNLGVLLGVAGRTKEAEAAYRSAFALEKELAASFPRVPDYQNQLAGTMGNLAGLMRDRGEFAEARELLESAAIHVQEALQANPHNPTYRQCFMNLRTMLASSLAGLGDLVGACRVAEQVAALGWDPAVDAYNAACVLAQCIPAVQKSAQVTGAKRQELIQAFSDRALTLLQQAVRKGFHEAAQIRKDTDLDPLRSRPKFQEMLKELEDKAARTEG